jgi:hypothetical protein
MGMANPAIVEKEKVDGVVVLTDTRKLSKKALQIPFLLGSWGNLSV